MRHKPKPAPSDISYLAYSESLLRESHPDLAERLSQIQLTWQQDGEALLADLEAIKEEHSFPVHALNAFLTRVRAVPQQTLLNLEP